MEIFFILLFCLIILGVRWYKNFSEEEDVKVKSMKGEFGMYIDADGTKVIPPIGFCRVLERLINSHMSEIEKDETIAFISNKKDFLSACRAAAVILTLDACWTRLGATKEQLKKISDNFLHVHIRNYDFVTHMQTISEDMKQFDSVGDQKLAVTDYLVNHFAPHPDAVGRTTLFIAVSTWTMSIMKSLPDFLKQFGVDNSGRVIWKG